MFSHLSEQKQLSPVGFPFACVRVGNVSGCFYGQCCQPVSSGWARTARLLYRGDVFADSYLQFAGKGSVKSALTVQ